MVEILIAENNTKLNVRQLHFLHEYLPESMIVRANQYRRWQDMQAYLISKFILVEGANKYGLTKSDLNKMQYTSYGRPYLSPHFDFNISHCEGYVICAISKQFKVGVDIENVRPIELEDFKNVFSEYELMNINQAQDRYAEFFKYWTIKEAAIKADGRGLSIPLKDIHIDVHVYVEGIKWHIHKLGIDAGCIAHLVVNGLLDAEKIVTKRIPLHF